MTSFKRSSLILCLALLGGCASTGYYETVNKLTNVTPNIAYAPAIDISYADVVSGNKNNDGVSVRWGGEVVDVSKIDGTLTRLTVELLPFGIEGRPINDSESKRKQAYFVVDLDENFSQNVSLNGHLVTLYGDVIDSQIISINSLKKSVPSIKLREIVDWDLTDREYFADKQRENGTYYTNARYAKYSRRSLASRFGHGSGFGYSYGHSSLGLSGHGVNSFDGGSFCRY